MNGSCWKTGVEHHRSLVCVAADEQYTIPCLSRLQEPTASELSTQKFEIQAPIKLHCREDSTVHKSLPLWNPLSHKLLQLHINLMCSQSIQWNTSLHPIIITCPKTRLHTTALPDQNGESGIEGLQIRVVAGDEFPCRGAGGWRLTKMDTELLKDMRKLWPPRHGFCLLSSSRLLLRSRSPLVCYNHRRTNLKESPSHKERSKTRTLQSTTNEKRRFLLTHKQQTGNPTTHRKLKRRKICRL